MWIEYIENKEGIYRIYKNIEPSIDNLYIHELIIKTGEDISLILRFDLAKLPEELPIKWEKEGVNTIQITMEFIGVHIKQLCISNINFYNGQLVIEGIKNNIKQIKYVDKSNSEVFNFDAKWIYIKSISGYHNIKAPI